MAALNFERRPVAGLAGSIELLSQVRPGQTLELAADLETADAEAVAYGGIATADGVDVVRLQDCVGPMVSLNDFDDPQSLRDRFAVLCGPGAKPGGFDGIPALVLDRTDSQRGESARATFQVPRSAPLFADHFPRRPVFPGTLLMHMNLQLAAALAAEMPPPPGGQWTLRTVRDVKLRAFIPPGDILELEAKLNERAADSATVTMEIRKGQKTIGGARVVLGLKEAA
jgi:3-hydroxymyristoyl/3-hydroxydecanoyl-(acyl carrier protein) dehydratase